MKQKITTLSLTVALITTIVSGMLIPAWSADDVKRMDKEQLKKVLNSDGTYVLDVRSGRDWNSSEFKIQGAKRANPSSFSEWASSYPKSGTLVLYCA
jgi:hypothetical protein